MQWHRAYIILDLIASWAPYTQGVGVIFMLHRVFPEADEQKALAPNRTLEVTPNFLDSVLDQVQDAGFDVISLDEAMRRLNEGEYKPFVCFTLMTATATISSTRIRCSSAAHSHLQYMCPLIIPMAVANYGGSH